MGLPMTIAEVDVASIDAVKPCPVLARRGGTRTAMAPFRVADTGRATSRCVIKRKDVKKASGKAADATERASRLALVGEAPSIRMSTKLQHTDSSGPPAYSQSRLLLLFCHLEPRRWPARTSLNQLTKAAHQLEMPKSTTGWRRVCMAMVRRLITASTVPGDGVAPVERAACLICLPASPGRLLRELENRP